LAGRAGLVVVALVFLRWLIGSDVVGKLVMAGLVMVGFGWLVTLASWLWLAVWLAGWLV